MVPLDTSMSIRRPPNMKGNTDNHEGSVRGTQRVVTAQQQAVAVNDCQRAVRGGIAVRRVCSLHLRVVKVRELIFADPTLSEPSNMPDMSEGAQRYWKWAVDFVNFTASLMAEAPEHAAVSEDRAYQLIEEARALLDVHSYSEAAQKADEAMRTPSAEPIGVRLHGLAHMATAALLSHHLEESVEAQRKLVTCDAQLGLTVDEAGSRVFLVYALVACGRHADAITVALEALEILERYPHLRALRAMLHRLAAANYSATGEYAAAGHHAMSAGELLQELSKWSDAAGTFSEACDAFTQENDYLRAEAASERTLECAQHHVSHCLVAQRLVTRCDNTLQTCGKPGNVPHAENTSQMSMRDALAQYAEYLKEHVRLLARFPEHSADAQIDAVKATMGQLSDLLTDPRYDSDRAYQIACTLVHNSDTDAQ